MTPSIDVQNLYKQFGNTLVVDNISLQVRKGEVLGFLGPNGAGKSTTMRMITGYLEPSDGSVSVCGNNMAKNPIIAKSYMGYLPEGSPLYSDMSAFHLLQFVARVRGLSGNRLKERMDWIVDTLHLQTVLNKSIDTLSKGFKRRVGLAQALIHDPEILVLDEPTDGLDPIQKQQVRDLIKSMSADKAIIISTHILEEVEPVCTRATIISRGQMVFDGSPAKLLHNSPEYNKVDLKLKCDDPDHVVAALRSLDGVDFVSHSAGDDGYNQFQIYPASDHNVEAPVSELCFSRQWRVASLYTDKGRLEEVFRKLATSQEQQESNL